MLFSATISPKTNDLAKLSLKKEPLYVGIDDNKDEATVSGLEQVISIRKALLKSKLLII
jgi:ATP-dependent RNA helicase DDX18/HAS1